MSDKITTFPVLEPINTASDGSTFSPQGTGGGDFSSQFTGDIYSSRGRFGNGSAYVDIGARDMHSSNYLSGSAGWKISYDGNVEINNLTLYGGNISYGKTSFTDSTNSGYWISSSGIYIGAASDDTYLKYDISSATFDLKATIKRTSDGAVCLDSLGDIINSNLNTSTQKILTDFTFTDTDYAGALKTGTVEWNTTTGRVSGGTGIVINDKGIMGALDGTEKFTLLTDGTATFAGALSAASGTFAGTMAASGITSGTITSQAITLSFTEGAGDCYIASTGFDAANWRGDGVVAMGIDDSDSNLAKLFVGHYTNKKYIKWDGTNLFLTGMIINYYFGNGSGNDKTYSVNTTLTDDIYAENITVNEGVTITTNGYRIFCLNTLTNNGTISNNAPDNASAGENGGNATGIKKTSSGGSGGTGAGAEGSYFGASPSGGAGGDSYCMGYSPWEYQNDNGDNGTSKNPSLGVSGSAGGNGGGNSSSYHNSPGSGGTAGTATSESQKISSDKVFSNGQVNYLYSYDAIVVQGVSSGRTLSHSAGSAGGGAGSMEHSCALFSGGGGGGAGGAGGIIYIASRTIINNGTISADGARGREGGAGALSGGCYSGGGGGGAGGAGGIIYLVYQNLTQFGSIHANGGSGGNAGSYGSATAGTAGNKGYVNHYKIY